MPPYRKKRLTNGPSAADVIPSREPGLTVADLLKRFNEETQTERQQRRQPGKMLFEATVAIQDHDEQALLADFLVKLAAHRRDPFAVTPAPKVNKLDVLIPVEEPKTSATVDEGSGQAYTKTPQTAPVAGEPHPTFEQARDALQEFANKKSVSEALAILGKLGFSKLKDLPEDRRRAFIDDLARELAS